MYLFNPLNITFVIYLLLMLSIGFFAWYKTKNFDDYILGGRSLGSFVTALSVGASDFSGWLLMGLPGALYLSGVSSSWIAIGMIIGAWLNWNFVAGPLRAYTEICSNSLTLPQYLTNRFDDKRNLIKTFSAIIILFFFAIYCASGVVASARLFESMFEISYSKAIWLGTAVTIIYTAIGGFLAVSWTDTLQASLMIFALLLVPVFILNSTDGITPALSIIESFDSIRLDWVGTGGIIAVISALAWGLGYFGQPHILVRFMAAKDLPSISTAGKIGVGWTFLCLLGAVSVGFFGIAYFQINQEFLAEVNSNPERIFIIFAKILFNPWISGILLSAILAAIMSTLSCQLLICSSTLTEDFYRGLIRPKASNKELVWVGKLMVLIIACLAIFIARDPDSKVLNLVSYAWAGFGASFGPVVLFSLFWKRMTLAGALVGMLTGALTVILWEYTGSLLYEIIPGLIAGTIGIISTSLLDKEPSEEIKTRHNLVKNKLEKS